MPRKTRTDTVAGALKAMDGANAEAIQPPCDMPLSDAERVKFDRIISSRPRDKWDEVDINQAANLASCLVEIDEIKTELRAEGRTLVNERGTVVANPLQSMLDAAVRRSITLGRYLHTHPEAKQGRAEKQGKAANAAKKAKAAKAGAGHLIKMPGA